MLSEMNNKKIEVKIQLTLTQSERNKKLKFEYLIFKENVCPSGL